MVDHPQQAHVLLFTDGLTPVCTEPYSEPDRKNIHKAVCHLTNYLSTNILTILYMQTIRTMDQQVRSERFVLRIT